ncbi:MAG: hypothetical protein ACKVP0_11600 [Pirellulaceae bacterium]
MDGEKYWVVKSWEEGFEFISHEATSWCAIEAKLLLYRQLSANHYSRFAKWNDIARSFADPVAQLIQEAMKAPGIPAFPQRAKDWLQGQLIGALLEAEFDDCARVTLGREQIAVLQSGHFPCGWYCRAAEDFPEKSPIIVY